MSFDKFFSKLAWSSMTLIAMYCAAQLKEMSRSVNDLNINVALLVERVANQAKIQEALSIQTNELERRVIRLERE